LWRRRENARRIEFVLPAGGQTGSLRTSARSEDAIAQFDSQLGLCGFRRAAGGPRGDVQPPRSGRGRTGEAAPMNVPPSSTWFSASPNWGWLIALYFFVGGLAGGCYFLAATIDLV